MGRYKQASLRSCIRLRHVLIASCLFGFLKHDLDLLSFRILCGSGVRLVAASQPAEGPRRLLAG